MELLNKIIETLPSSPQVEEVCIGAFDTMVKSLRWGLSSTFRDLCPGRFPAWVRGAGELVGQRAGELARYALSERLLEASLGMAAINSLLPSEGLVFREVNAARIIAERGKNGNVAVVGDFPFLKKIAGEVKNLWTISKRPWEAEEGIREARELLPRADVVAITGSSFINHSTEALLSYCPRAYTIILGPTTPLTPLLFRYGADVLCGVLVEDPTRALPSVWQGASFRQIPGLKLVALFKDGVEPG